MTITDARLSISAVADATGLSTHTLRYYERVGLLDRVDRASSSHRRYSESDVNWVVFLTRLRGTGMPIARVREYAELVRRGDDTVRARLDLLLEHRVAVLAELAEITRSLDAIDKKIDLYREKTKA